MDDPCVAVFGMQCMQYARNLGYNMQYYIHLAVYYYLKVDEHWNVEKQ